VRLEGKVAIITGAGSGQGRAAAIRFCREGANVVVSDVDTAGGEQTVADIAASGGTGQATFVSADVSDEDQVRELAASAASTFGKVDILYNNAGIEGDITPIVRYSLETFRRVLDVNVVGVFLGLKHVLPVMLKQNRGSIINTASIAGLIGSPDIPAYTASKHAVIGLTKSAAIECAGTAVRVNCVCPGLIDSRMLSAIVEGRNTGNAPVPNEKIVDRTPARRLGLASEVASVVAFLASDDASYVTGSAYTVDGGRTTA